MTETNLSERQNDIVELRDKISEVKRAENVKRESVDEYVRECKAAGLNVTTGTSEADKEAFDAIGKGYKESDSLAETRKEFERRLEVLVVTTGNEADAATGGDLDHPRMRAAVTLAERFLHSEAYKALKRSGDLDMEGTKPRTSAVQIATREAFKQMLFPSHRAAVSSDALVPDDTRLNDIVSIPRRQLVVRDLVNSSTTDSDAVDWVEQTVRTNAAAETPYGTAAPESSYTWVLRSTAVKRIPHFVKATRGQLADAGQLRDLLDTELAEGVGERLDGQMINGLGTGNDLRGILETVGLQSIDGTGQSVPDMFHKGLTAVRLALLGRNNEPDAFLLHPTDYEAFVLSKGTDGHYQNRQGPQFSEPASIWGKPVVQSTVVAQGTGLVGNWKRGSTLFLRSGINLAVTDSDAEDFTKGIITLLAEMRAAFAVKQVASFIELSNIGVVS